jgi:1,4-dihydroxy-6-naphthoate synthase
MNTDTLHIALSPCPNDTFIFGAWVLGNIPEIPGYCSRFVWEDIQQLNEDAQKGDFDIIKVSAVQALRLTRTYTILPYGGAFGLEHGPKLVARPGVKNPRRIAVPGMLTTAACLLKAALGYSFEPVPLRFDQEIAALNGGTVDAALLIHETALVYRDYGLDLLLDLGKWWQGTSGNLPLPLGVIIIRKDREEQLFSLVADQIGASLGYAHAHSLTVMPFIQAMAQEMNSKTLEEHIRAYVNTFSLHAGDRGQAALAHLQGLMTD